MPAAVPNTGTRLVNDAAATSTRTRTSPKKKATSTATATETATYVISTATPTLRLSCLHAVSLSLSLCRGIIKSPAIQGTKQQARISATTANKRIQVIAIIIVIITIITDNSNNHHNHKHNRNKNLHNLGLMAKDLCGHSIGVATKRQDQLETHGPASLLSGSKPYKP